MKILFNPFPLLLFAISKSDTFHTVKYPTENFLSSTEIRDKLGIFPCIINSGIPVSFLGLRRDGKWASLEWRELDGTGSGPVLNAWDREFTAFSEKKIWYPKTRPGMQTSNSSSYKKDLFIYLMHFHI